MIYQNQTELNAALAYWQAVLKLQHWDVQISFKCHLDKGGEVFYKMGLYQAIIHLIDPLDAQDWDFPYDPEKILVHELLHLYFVSFDRIPELESSDNLAYDQVELAISQLASILVILNRKGS